MRVPGPYSRRPGAPAWAGQEVEDVLEDMTQDAGRAPLRTKKEALLKYGVAR